MNILAFDFSCNKPAMCSYIDNEINFYIWPLNIDTKSQDILSKSNVHVYNRNLSTIKTNEYNEHTLIVEHVKRAKELANIITQTIIDILAQHNITDYSEVIIANEGFAYSSKGDATLQLSGYKYILMNKLIDAGFKVFRTYSPITIKATAHCAKRGSTKEDMINRLSEEDNVHKLFKILKESPEQLKKKTNYVTCLDDVADSYWCLKTTLIKEGVIRSDELTEEESNVPLTYTVTLKLRMVKELK